MTSNEPTINFEPAVDLNDDLAIAPEQFHGNGLDPPAPRPPFILDCQLLAAGLDHRHATGFGQDDLVDGLHRSHGLANAIPELLQVILQGLQAFQLGLIGGALGIGGGGLQAPLGSCEIALPHRGASLGNRPHEGGAFPRILRRRHPSAATGSGVNLTVATGSGVNSTVADGGEEAGPSACGAVGGDGGGETPGAALLWAGVCGAGAAVAAGDDVSLGTAGAATAGCEESAPEGNAPAVGRGLADGVSDAGGRTDLAASVLPRGTAAGCIRGRSALTTRPTISTPASVRTPVRAQLSHGKPSSSSVISEANAEFLPQVTSRTQHSF